MSAARLAALLKAEHDSCLTLAKRLGVTQKTLSLILRAKGIAWTPWAHRPLLAGMSRQALTRLYLECCRNRRRMAQRLGVNVWTLRRRMIELGFKPRRRGDNSGACQRMDVCLTRAVLHDLYVVRGLSLRQIGRVVNSGHDAVARHMRRYKIPRRAFGTSSKVVPAEELAALRQRLTTRHIDDMMAHLIETSPHLRNDED